jgi:MFS family permease
VVTDKVPAKAAGAADARAGAIGKIGAATGVGMALGPGLGMLLLSDYRQAVAAGLCANLLAALVVLGALKGGGPPAADGADDEGKGSKGKDKAPPTGWGVRTRRVGAQVSAPACTRLARTPLGWRSLGIALRLPLSPEVVRRAREGVEGGRPRQAVEIFKLARDASAPIQFLLAVRFSLTARARPGRFSALRVSHSKSVFEWRFSMGARGA